MKSNSYKNLHSQKLPGQWLQTVILLRSLGWRSFSQKAYVLLAGCLFFVALVASGLAYFSAGVQQALNHDIADFLGAPLVIRSEYQLPDQWWVNAGGAGAGIEDPVQTVSLTHGATGPLNYHSIALKGVSSTYPLQDAIKLHNGGGEFTARGEHLMGHQAWLDARAMAVLGAEIGDQIYIGEVAFTVTAQVLFEPDRLTQLQHILPRVMVHLNDLNTIGLQLDNGRNEFRYLFNADKVTLDQFESSLPDRLAVDYQVLKPDEGGHPFSRMAERADKMLGMVMVLVLLLCGAAAAILASFSIRKYVLPVTVMRCMGLKREVFTYALMLQLILVACVSGLLGSWLGWRIQPVLKEVLSPHLILADLSFRWQVSLTTLGMTLLTLLAFVYPRLKALSSIPVNQVLRGHTEVGKNQLFSMLSVLVCVVLLLWYHSDNLRLTLYLCIGVVVLVLLALAFGWLLNKSTGFLHHFNHGIVRVALRSIGRSPQKHMATMTTMALAVMALLMTANLRGSFLDRYQVQRLSHDGNYLFSGLPVEQRSDFVKLLQNNQVSIKGNYPTVTAKLHGINGVAIDQALTEESDTREETRSPVRLSWSESLPANNDLISGQWPEVGSGDVSVEAEVMSDLGLEIGDELEFKIGEEYLSAKISSSRTFKSGGSMVMFWFMFAPDGLVDFAQYDMGGIEIMGDSKQVIKQITAEFPTVLITDLEEQVGRMRAIMVAMTKMMDSILVLLVSAALTVLMASAFAGMHTQYKLINLMRAMGVVKKKIYLMLLVEQAVVGFVACLIGVLGAQLIAGLMFKQQFGVTYVPDWGGLTLLMLLVTSVFAVMGLLIANHRIKKPIELYQQL